VPTISFRDLAIQRRENDLVAGSFGRGIFVLDDYSPLRTLSESELAKPALLFAPRAAWWYVPKRPFGDSTPGPSDQGAAYFVAPNPPFGAVFTYYLADDLTTRAKKRQEADKPLIEAGKDTPFPPWEELERERREAEPAVELVVRDADGKVVRRLSGATAKGFHRVAWDLRLPAPEAITSKAPPDDGDGPLGALAAPGRYTVSLARRVDGQTAELAHAQPFDVAPLRAGTLPGAPPVDSAAFGARLDALQRRLTAAGTKLDRAVERIELAALALERSHADATLDTELHALRQEIYDLEVALRGEPRKNELSVPQAPTISSRYQAASFGLAFSTYGPTPTHRRSLELAEQELAGFEPRLERVVVERLSALEKKLAAAGAPYTP
jgi:hypothetical protein